MSLRVLLRVATVLQWSKDGFFTFYVNGKMLV